MSSFNSPFCEYIRTNYVPSTREKAHISQLLVVPQREVCVLDAEIMKLQKKFNEIKTKRDGLANDIVEHRRLVSPFRRIPDNILKMIFLDCLPIGRNASMTIDEAPLLLGSVSKRWRYVSYNTPYLWSTLHIGHIPPSTNFVPEADLIPPENPMTPQVESHLHAVLQWLNRSGTCPLSISIHPSIGGFHFRLYLPTLLSFAHRWFSLELFSTHESAVLDLACLPSEAFPILEVLRLTFSNWMDLDSQLQRGIKSGILNAQNLRSVAIHFFPLDLAIIEIDWSRLTSLILCDPSSAARKSTPGEAYRILSHCKNLIRLTMAINDPSPTGVFSTTPIPYLYLPYLESLSVNDYYHHLASIFDAIDAPSLKHVSYSTRFWPSIVRRSPLVALLSRNGESVRTLTTDPRYLSLDDIVNCFKMTPFLHKFACKASRLFAPQEQPVERQEAPITAHIMKAIFQLLVPTDDGQCYWPRVQSIECKIFGLNDQDVVTFIQKRMTASTRLKSTLQILPLLSVKISFRCPKQMDLALLLEEYTRNGLRLDLYDYWNSFDGWSASAGQFDPCAGITTPHIVTRTRVKKQ